MSSTCSHLQCHDLSSSQLNGTSCRQTFPTAFALVLLFLVTLYPGEKSALVNPPEHPIISRLTFLASHLSHPAVAPRAQKVNIQLLADLCQFSVPQMAFLASTYVHLVHVLAARPIKLDPSLELQTYKFNCLIQQLFILSSRDLFTKCNLIFLPNFILLLSYLTLVNSFITQLLKTRNLGVILDFFLFCIPPLPSSNLAKTSL